MKYQKVKVTIKQRGLIDILDDETNKFFKEKDREQEDLLFQTIREGNFLRTA